MTGTTSIGWVPWIAFVLFILTALAVDLGVFNSRPEVVSVKKSLGWTLLWCSLAMLFGFRAAPQWIDGWTKDDTAQFVTGYIVELSLSMDNVFVIAVIFSYFKVPAQLQHRVLFWGILGAMLMRGVMILAGTALIAKFHVLLLVMGGILILTGVRMFFAGDSESSNPGENWVVRKARQLFPVAESNDGTRFVTRHGGRLHLTPLALVLLMVETTDVMFALDSIPAIFGITKKPFLIFTSNVFAILGLRSLYFVLASAMKYFRFLKYGLALVLISIGIKMLFEKPLKSWLGNQLTNASLGLVLAILVTSVLASIFLASRETSPAKT